MDPRVVLPALTSILALVFAVALFDQWRERRGTFQIVWTLGMLFYGVASACEAIGGASGWNEALYRTWYLTGAVWTAGWLGLGTAVLLGRTRFRLQLRVLALLRRHDHVLPAQQPPVPGCWHPAAPVLHLGRSPGPRGRGRDLLPERAVAAARRVAVLGATIPVGRAHGLRRRSSGPGLRPPDPATGVPVATLFPPQLRLLTPFMNITGALALILGAIFSAYVFMPKRRVLAYSLDSQPARRRVPVQPPDRAGRDSSSTSSHRCRAPSVRCSPVDSTAVCRPRS